MASPGVEKPNIRQVAQLAGVSHMTVSRVLNDHPNIRESTRRRVEEAIEELGYRPSLTARALATQRSHRIGVLVESATTFGPTSTLYAVESAARASGYEVSSVFLQAGAKITPQEAVDHLVALGVDALCVVAPRSSSIADLRRIAVGVPVLVVKPDKDPTFLTVTVDQRAGTALAVDHLVALGHRDILHLAGPLDWLDARSRERAFHARAKSWGIRERPVVVGDWTADFAYEFARGIRELPEYTAVFVANDDMAVGLVHGLHERGFSVPDDLSVVGFDDIPLARHVIPPLTTVRQNFDALGVSIVEVLRAAIEEREIPDVTRISAEIVTRASSARPRKTA
ncbi:LacI family DNA-binding transcriptional regulator [Isoptericola dokdonensis]|jgi:DNA-binding LacI/PurR family transcriptional regulator|uniref:Lactose operon repressor n=1 Tax=Isoptericola dokdonensis DS-3 TaxID=1300344 RepID=A0A161HPQ1_9MICO|nr:LacI family DNA-binding transcriptional regulator [Isoptericola dokdonensis]ANC31022.1 Lactose operon repressor [Isoptericola dokdonensis DS-3]